MVGTFYRAGSPESPPFVDIGKEVTEESVVCIIEAMKVMNEIKAETSGDDRRNRGREWQAGAIRPGALPGRKLAQSVASLRNLRGPQAASLATHSH